MLSIRIVALLFCALVAAAPVPAPEPAAIATPAEGRSNTINPIVFKYEADLVEARSSTINPIVYKYEADVIEKE